METTQDLLRSIRSASPTLSAALNDADREVHQAFEESLDDLRQTVSEGSAVRDEAKRRSAELVASLSDMDVQLLSYAFSPYFTYENGIELMDSLSYSLPVFYKSVETAKQPVKTNALKMKKGVQKYVSQTMTDMRRRYPRSTSTILQLEKKLTEEIDQVTEKSFKKMDGLMSYETAKATNCLSPREMRDISVVQTGPEFSYMVVDSVSPSFASALNDSEARLVSQFSNYTMQLQPFFNGQLLSPSLFGVLPNFVQYTNSTKKMMEDLQKEVEVYMENDYKERATLAAKVIAAQKGAMEELQQQMMNNSMSQYTPMLLNSFYSYSPMLYTQALDISAWTQQALLSSRQAAVNYAYMLVLNMFGQYEWALVPIQKMGERLQNGTDLGGNRTETAESAFPQAMMQVTTTNSLEYHYCTY